MDDLQNKIREYEKPKRKPLSIWFPFLLQPIIKFRKLCRFFLNKLTLKKLYKGSFFDKVVARHSSPLYRKLGESDPVLQENKIKNLEIAISYLNGLIIPPGKTFSLFDVIGNISRSKGYVDGMLLSDGKVVSGLGGGLCQLSNFLMWIFLHTDIRILERHHHSMDVFPDSGRTIPFGSGATIFCNYLDLKIKNLSKHPLQLKIWLTDNMLKGQILSNYAQENKYHLIEKNHCFVKKGEKYFRYNEIYRETYIKGNLVKTEKIFTNFAPVIYEVDDNYLTKNNYKLVEIKN